MALSKEDKADMVRLIQETVRETVLEVAPAIIEATLASTAARRLEADEVGDILDREAHGQTERAYQRGLDQGLTAGQAEYRASLSTGCDPTPEVFSLPTRKTTRRIRSWDDTEWIEQEFNETYSYFSPPAGSPEGKKVIDFRALFEGALKAGRPLDVAYEDACSACGVPSLRRQASTSRQLGRKEEDERLLLKGGIFGE